MKPVNIAEFARLKGVSAQAVHKAIDSGRLVECLRHDPKYKKPRIDPVVAAQEWERNTDHSRRTVGADIRPKPEKIDYSFLQAKAAELPQPTSGPSLNQSKAILEAYKARLAKLDYDEKVGKLVEVEKVKAEAFKLARAVRDNLFNIPDRVAAEFAGCNNAAEIHMRLNDELRKAMEEIIAQQEHAHH